MNHEIPEAVCQRSAACAYATQWFCACGHTAPPTSSQLLRQATACGRHSVKPSPIEARQQLPPRTSPRQTL